VTSGDPSLVHGSRRLDRDNYQHGPALVTSWKLAETTPLPMQDLKRLLLARMFGDA
jgi:hypothetical protein